MPKSTVVPDVVLPKLDVTEVDKHKAFLHCCAIYGHNAASKSIQHYLGEYENEIRSVYRERSQSNFYQRQLLSALTQLAELTPEIEELKGSRVHTQEWYASHYAKLHDWARKVLPYPYRNQYFSCVANGTYDVTLDRGESYMCKAGFMVTPSGYIPMDDAKGQIIREQTTRAEDAELRAEAAGRKLAELRAASEEALNHSDCQGDCASESCSNYQLRMILERLPPSQPSPASAVSEE